jgi:glutamine synthetase
VSTLAAATDALAARDVSAVVVTIVDNLGVARATAIPIGMLEHAAEIGLRVSPSFTGASDDLRLRLDWSGLRVLSVQPGWAWAPADQVNADGEPFPGCQRSFLRRMVGRANASGLTFRVGCDLAWFLSDRDDGAPTVASLGPAYGFAGLARLSGLGSDLLDAFSAAGIEVSQFHRGLGAGEVGLSLAASDPVTAADAVVFARETIRATSVRHGWRCSFYPPSSSDVGGEGDRLRLSAWRTDQNLLADGDRPRRMTRLGEALAAGLLSELPALIALGAPTKHGRAPLRFVDGRAAGAARLAWIEARGFDHEANPYIAIGMMIAAGLAGIERDLRLPAQVDKLPTSLDAALDALQRSTTLRAAMGASLHAAYMATRKTQPQPITGVAVL